MLTIGFISPYERDFRIFKYNNTMHKIIHINHDKDRFRGVEFDLIICGENWKLVDDIIVNHAYLRIIKLN